MNRQNQEISLPQEGLNFALQFIRTENEDLDDKAEKAKRVLDAVLHRLGVIEKARGMTLYVLGGLISELKRGPVGAELWRRIPGTGYENWWMFGEFCQQALGMSLGRANLLENLWKKSQLIDFTPEEIESLGLTASNHIVRLARNRNDVDLMLEEFDNAHNNAEFLERAKVRLGKELASVNGRPEPSPPLLMRRVFLSSDETKFFDETIELAAKDMDRNIGVTTTTKDCLLFLMLKWRSALS